MKKMKLYKYVGLSALCLSLNSCADFIDNAPDDILTLEMVFEDKTRMEDWLAGVYQQIRDRAGLVCVMTHSRCLPTI